MPENIPRRLEALSETAEELVHEINKLNRDTDARVEGVTKRLRRNYKMMWLIIASFIVDIAVTGACIWAVQSSNSTSADVKHITKRLDYGQQVQRRKVLCPLYKIFEDSKSPEARKTNPQGPDAYDKAFKIIDEGYKALECNKPLPKQPITPVKPNH